MPSPKILLERFGDLSQFPLQPNKGELDCFLVLCCGTCTFHMFLVFLHVQCISSGITTCYELTNVSNHPPLHKSLSSICSPHMRSFMVPVSSSVINTTFC